MLSLWPLSSQSPLHGAGGCCVVVVFHPNISVSVWIKGVNKVHSQQKPPVWYPGIQLMQGKNPHGGGSNAIERHLQQDDKKKTDPSRNSS